MRRDFPNLRVIPVAADFSRDFTFPAFDFDHARIAVFYAGSSLGNFEPEEASAFLARLARAAGPGSRLLLGADRKKDKAILDRAYNDPGGLNAAFNRNILNNVNRLADGDFDPEKWIPHQFYDERRGRIELWLESAGNQTVRVAGETFRFAAGDRIPHRELLQVRRGRGPRPRRPRLDPAPRLVRPGRALQRLPVRRVERPRSRLPCRRHGPRRALAGGERPLPPRAPAGRGTTCVSRVSSRWRGPAPSGRSSASP